MKKSKLKRHKNKELDKIFFKKGTIVKFYGMPFSLPKNLYLLGRIENYKCALEYKNGLETGVGLCRKRVA